MKSNQKKTVRYTGICYTTARDNQPSVATVESYGSNKDTVLKKTLAGALCFGENTFQIATSEAGHYTRIEHYTITNPTAGEFTLTDI